MITMVTGKKAFTTTTQMFLHTYMSWYLRLCDVLVNDVTAETLLFFLLPHKEDTLMNENVLLLHRE